MALRAVVTGDVEQAATVLLEEFERRSEDASLQGAAGRTVAMLRQAATPPQPSRSASAQ
jgi:hypothetical protein